MRFNNALWAAVERLAEDRNMTTTDYIRSLMVDAVRGRKRRNRVRNPEVLELPPAENEHTEDLEIVLTIVE